MSKQDDIIKEAKREYVEKFVGGNYDKFQNNLTKKQTKPIEVWQFIETQIKKALQAREREIIEAVKEQIDNTQRFQIPSWNDWVIKVEEIEEKIENLSNKTKKKDKED